MTTRGPVPVGKALERLLDDLAAPPPDVLATVFGRWEEVVGPAAAQHCRPVAVEGERLVVVASDTVWASELQWLSSSVLERINAICEGSRLRSLSVRVAHPGGGRMST